MNEKDRKGMKRRQPFSDMLTGTIHSDPEWRYFDMLIITNSKNNGLTC